MNASNDQGGYIPFDAIILKTLVLTFIAEAKNMYLPVTFGFTTFISVSYHLERRLGATQNFWGVILGGVLGHAIYTVYALRVDVQSLQGVANRIAAAISGALFIAFGMTGLKSLSWF